MIQFDINIFCTTTIRNAFRIHTDLKSTVNVEIFTHMRSFTKIKPSQFSEITLSFTDIGESCPYCEFSKSQICVLTLFAKIKFSQKFPNLQYLNIEIFLEKSLKIKSVCICCTK